MTDCDNKSVKRMGAAAWKRTVFGIGVLLALSPVGLVPLAEWLLWREWDTDYLDTLVICLVAGPAICIPGLLICCVFSRYRPLAIRLLLLAVVTLSSHRVGSKMADPMRRRALEQVTVRAEPLVTAIRRFEADNGNPPAELATLIPAYLTEIPTPRFPGAPSFDYRVPDQTNVFGGNTWILRVTPEAVSFHLVERLVYLPNQNYPQQHPQLGWRWGGIQRLGTWACYYPP